jgi:uncharacterized protein (TIGR03118 family)
MKKIFPFACIALSAGTLILSGCIKPHDQEVLKDFTQVNLVDNNHQYNATFTDPALLNAWGLVFNTGGVAWISAQSGHVSTIYDKEGATLRPPVAIPSPVGATGGNPSGIVFSASTTDFLLSNNLGARFIFVGVDGILSAWNAGNNAQVIKNNSATSSYTGLALASNGGANYLYATDFKGNKIDVWDKNFEPVSLPFRDPSIPSGYAPFNIQAVESWLYVTYAKVGTDGRSEAGSGRGFVDIYTTAGRLARRFASRGSLNAPWGVAMAPVAFFGSTDDNHNNKGDDHGHNNGNDNSGPGNNNGNDDHGDHSGEGHGGNDDLNQPLIVIGNFGDGHITAFTLDGKEVGQMKSHGRTLKIEGLWALSFPPATATAIDPNRLYFTAGPAGEKDGLFGYLIKP